MDLPESEKVFYSVDYFPSSDVNILPSKAKCGLCTCLPNSHPMYWKCPLVQGFICAGCCQEEVPQEANLHLIHTRTGYSTAQEVVSICGPCKKNCLQE